MYGPRALMNVPRALMNGPHGPINEPLSEPPLLRFFTSHEQLAAGGAGQHHGERLASRDARQRTSTSTNGGRHSLMLTQLDINCIFCWPMCDYGLSSHTAFVSCVRQFFISSFYNSTSRLNAFKKLASYYSSKQPLERIYKLASSSEADLRGGGVMGVMIPPKKILSG